jgi:hypothetical protein
MLASLPSQKKNILSGKLFLMRKKYKFNDFLLVLFARRRREARRDADGFSRSQE